jgi:NAD(P)H dehydrogenase (quinone)
MDTEAPTLLVTGASGRLGRLVLEHLRRRHAGHIVAATRNPDKLADLAQRGIELRAADFDDPASIKRAFARAQRVLIISTDAHDVPGRRLRQHENAIDIAARSGVQHLLYTSLTRCEPGSPMKIAPDHWRTEQALQASGLPYTVLRNNLYAEIVLEFLPQALQLGTLFAAADEGAVAWVPRNDVARAAAAALHAPPPGNTVLDVTGAAAVPYAELARLAAAASGRPLVYRAVAPDAIAQGMVRAGLPRHVIDVLLSFQLAAARGELAVCTNAIEQLTGQAPQTLGAFMQAHAGALALKGG